MQINKDFYRDLPGMVCLMLDRYIKEYKGEPWFEKAWEEYRKHIKTSDMNSMRMPGFVFKKYIKHGGVKMEYYLTYDELYHSGILGMKWGVRRFQNEDGTLTEEGKRRYRRDPITGKYVKRSKAERKAYDKKVAQLKAAAKEKKNKSPREKKINELTDKQLQKYIDRMRNEKAALELRNSINQLDPKPVSAGKKFMDKFMKDAIIPAVTNVGKAYIERALKQMIGLEKNNNNNNNNQNSGEKNNNNSKGKAFTDNQKSQIKKLIDAKKSYDDIMKVARGFTNSENALSELSRRLKDANIQ